MKTEVMVEDLRGSYKDILFAMDEKTPGGYVIANADMSFFYTLSGVKAAFKHAEIFNTRSEAEFHSERMEGSEVMSRKMALTFLLEDASKKVYEAIKILVEIDSSNG